MRDSDLLINVQERIRQATEDAGGRPETFQRIARIGLSEYPISDDELESALEWEDAEVYLSLGGDDTGEWDIPETAEDWKSLTQEDCFWFDHIPELSEQQMKELDDKADAFEFQRLIGMNVIEEMSDMDAQSEICKELSSKFVRTWRPKRRSGEMEKTNTTVLLQA